MIGVTKKMFFDRAAVMKKVKDGTKSALSKAGSFVRRTAKGLIRPAGKNGKSARPGNPPKSHTDKLRSRIFFGYDDQTESVVIGPELFRQQKPPAPALLESGGTLSRHWRTGKPSIYRKFPFMEAALRKEQDKFPDLFANAVK